MDLPEETTGSDYTPSLKITQPRNGYRFTEDAVALAEFIEISPEETLLDIGAGVGVIPLLLWQRSPFSFAVGVEMQESLAALALRNVQQNAMADHIAIVQNDACLLSIEGLMRQVERIDLANGFDVVCSNPPYRPKRAGRLNPNIQKAIARHELHLNLSELVIVARKCLKPGGRFYLVHLAKREKEICCLLKKENFHLIRRQYHGPFAAPHLVLVGAGLKRE